MTTNVGSFQVPAWLLWLAGTLFFVSGERTMSADDQGKREVVNRPPELVFNFPADHAFHKILFSPDSKLLLGVGMNSKSKAGLIDFFEVETQKLVRTIEQPELMWEAAFTPDGQRLITTSQDKKIRTFAGPDWKLERTVDNDTPGVMTHFLAIFPDGKRFVTGNRHRKGPRIWSAGLEKVKRLPFPPDEGGSGVAVSRDGKRFAVAYSAPFAEIWDAEKLQIAGRLELGLASPSSPYRGAIASIAYSPNGKTIATGYIFGIGGQTIGIWDSKNLKKLRDCVGFNKNATAPDLIAYSHDGKLLLACTNAYKQPTQILIWEVETGKLVYELHPPEGARMALSPDGKWLAYWDYDSVLRLWDFTKIRKEIGK